MQLQIQHVTNYTYDQPVGYALQKLRLRPLTGPMQEVGTWTISVDGGQIETSYLDHYGNHVDLVSAQSGTNRLTVTAEGDVTTYDKAGILGQTYGKAPLWHFVQPTDLTEAKDGIKDLAQVLQSSSATLDNAHALAAAVLERVPYEIGQTDTSTTAEQALGLGRGVCQDHANIFIAAARCAGMPARYVSGYLMMNDRIDQDASHAWAELHIENLGWVGFDVSNSICPDERYVRIAIGRDAADAAPVSGLRRGNAAEQMIVSLQVQQ